MKYILYARKSTESEDRQKISIESQIAECKEYAEKFDLTIADIRTESKSAKKIGRPVFNSVIQDIESGKYDGILAWHPDRLSRNAIDAGRIIYHLGEDVIKNLKFASYSFTNDPNGLFVLGIALGQAQYKSQQLSVDVKRGHKREFYKGKWPSYVTVGYKNVNSQIELDEEKAIYIKQAYSLHNTGKYSLKEIRDKLIRDGFTTKRGNKPAKSVIEAILKNPFYYGWMKHSNKEGMGTHVPIISKADYDLAQEVFADHNNGQRQKRNIPYKGYFTCAECGCVITAEVKKEIHTYYHCTHAKKWCSQRREATMSKAQVEDIIVGLFQPLALDSDIARKSLDLYIADLQDQKQTYERAKVEIKKNLSSIQNKRSKLLDEYLKGVIPKDLYQLKETEYNQQIISAEERINNQPTQKVDSTFEQLENFRKHSVDLVYMFQEGDQEVKDDLLESVLSNALLQDYKVIEKQYKLPWELVEKMAKSDDIEKR